MITNIKENNNNKYLTIYLSLSSLFIIASLTCFGLDKNFINDCKSLVVWEIFFLTMNLTFIYYCLNATYFKLKLLLVSIFVCFIFTLLVYLTNYTDNYKDQYKFIYNCIRVVFYLYCGLGCYLLLWGVLIVVCIIKSYIA
jgi:hypothetical protein